MISVEKVYKRAFYHAYSNALLDENNYITRVELVKNRCVFYDIDPSKESNAYTKYIVGRPNIVAIEVIRPILTKSEFGHLLINRLINENDKNKFKAYTDYWLQTDQFVDHDFYVDAYYYIKTYIRHVYESYIEAYIDDQWRKYKDQALADIFRLKLYKRILLECSTEDLDRLINKIVATSHSSDAAVEAIKRSCILEILEKESKE